METTSWKHLGKVYGINAEEKTVSVPRSIREQDYPPRIKKAINELNYRKQLTIE